MATHERSVLGPNTKFDSSGQVYPQSFANFTTNDIHPCRVIVFTNSGVTNYIYGEFPVPNDYVDTATINIYWTGVTNTGVVRWGFSYTPVGGDDAESLDPSSATETVEQNDDAPSTTLYQLKLSISLTDGNFAVGDQVQFSFYRESGDAADNYGDSALLKNLTFQYNDA